MTNYGKYHSWHQKLEQLHSHQRNVITKVLSTIDSKRAGVTIPDVVAALIDMSKSFSQVTGKLGVDAFKDVDDTGNVTGLSPAPIMPDKPMGDLFAKMLTQGLDGKQQDRVEGAAQKVMFNQFRDTIVKNAGRTKQSCRRVAEDNACPFCRLASLNTFTDQVKAAQSYHPNCRCFVVLEKDYVLDPRQAQWENEYTEAVRLAGGTKRSRLLSEWQKLINDH